MHFKDIGKKYDYQFHAKWGDELIWDEQNFTFYNNSFEVTKREAFFIKKIVDARLRIQDFKGDLNKNCNEENDYFLDFVQKTELMNILTGYSGCCP